MLTKSPVEHHAPDLAPSPGSARASHAGRRALLGVLVAVALLLVSGTVSQPVILPYLPLVFPFATIPDTVIAEIQRLIQRADDQQAQAFANHDPTLMADTAASDYYQQLVQTNQNLLEKGVTSIRLVTIEWSSINLSGTTATATNWETWSTTYSDSTTEQSRDRNVYTLVQTDGGWKIQSDTHPDQAQPAVGKGPRRPTPVPTQLPVTPGQPGGESISHNWAGYAATGGAFTGVSATWSVPEFAHGGDAGAEAAWVGIGRVRSTDLIQAGTQQVASGSRSTLYKVWVELLPQASQPVALSVYPGDSISVSIAQQGPSLWLISFSNNTTGQTYQVTERYVSSMSSAEWVAEAPSSMRGRLLPLDDFGTIAFGQAMAIKDGQTATIADAGGRAITMIGSRGQALAVASPLDAASVGFSVARSGTP